ncbi:MAG: amino acid adenylation domain-containing protein, partial [bacterium]|nr:amino acid adenylation domain-containing protein [bacterium]
RPVEPQQVADYSRYIKWLEKQDKEIGLAYWKEHLAGCTQQTPVPHFNTQEKSGEFRAGDLNFNIDKDLSEALIDTAKKNKVTLNTLFQSMWGILLQKYNDTPDVLFGAVVSGRPVGIAGIETMVGLFINTVPVRVTTTQGLTVAQLLETTQRNSLASKNVEYLPLSDIQLQFPSKNEMFNHVLVFENYPVSPDMGGAEAEKSGVGFDIDAMDMVEQTNYPLNLLIGPEPPIELKFNYNASVYSKDFLQGLFRHFCNIARQVADNSAITVDRIRIMDEEEKQRILVDFNKTETDFPADTTLYRLFREQVEKTPDNTAMVTYSALLPAGAATRNHEPAGSNRYHFTYRVLDESATRIANHLSAAGAGPGKAVALIADRTAEMIICIMGILRTGAAYLPLDPGQPRDRLDYLLDDSNVPMVLKDRRLCKDYQAKPITLYIDDLLWAENGEAEPEVSQIAVRNHRLCGSASDMAYIIYTSGTTGKPKGVAVTHANALRLVRETNYLAPRPEMRLLQAATYAFDASIFEFFLPLLNGAMLVMPPREWLSDMELLANEIRTEAVNVLFLTTALFNTVVDLDLECLEHVDSILFGGERVSKEHVKKGLNYMGPGRILHVYGPTESTVYATYYPIEHVRDNRATIPIGKPLSNTTAYILDRNSAPVPVGVTGQLFLGGAGIALGYLNRPEATCEVFKKNHLQTADTVNHPGEDILYATGDLARFTPEYQIEFVGRNDRQVKIRGFRIELGEIESIILKYHTIKEVLVRDIDTAAGTKDLCAYIVPATPDGLEEGDRRVQPLKDHLSHHLPSYMVPLHFFRLESIPLTTNGKVDTNALPVPHGNASQREYVPPGNITEGRLVEIWADILGLEKEHIGITDNFFDLGGHSLRAMTLIARVQKDLDVKITLQQVFKTPSIRELAHSVEHAGEGQSQDIKAVEKRAYYPLSSAQKRLFIFQHSEPLSTGYNVPAVMQLEGDLDRKKFQDVFLHLLKRHESLRTSFRNIAGAPVQVVHELNDISFEVTFCETSDPGEIDTIIGDFVQPFDLARAPLIRAGLVRMEEKKYVVMIDIHHIVTDGTSMDLLSNELAACYNGMQLPPLELQYRDFSHWQNRTQAKGSDAYKRLEAFWLKQLEGRPPVLDLPYDFPRSANRDFRGRDYIFFIDREQTAAIKQCVNESESTLFIFLLALTDIWLSKLSGLEDIAVGTAVEGRLHSDLRHIIGMFVNTLVLRNFPRHNKTFSGFLMDVKDRTLDAFENQD